MNINQKVKIYKQAASDTSILPFAERNLILANLARGLGLVHWYTIDGFELCHPNRKYALAKVK